MKRDQSPSDLIRRAQGLIQLGAAMMNPNFQTQLEDKNSELILLNKQNLLNTPSHPRPTNKGKKFKKSKDIISEIMGESTDSKNLDKVGQSTSSNRCI